MQDQSPLDILSSTGYAKLAQLFAARLERMTESAYTKDRLAMVAADFLLQRWFEGFKADNDVQRLTTEHVREYVGYVRMNAESPDSRKVASLEVSYAVRGLRLLFDVALANGLIYRHPMSGAFVPINSEQMQEKILEALARMEYDEDEEYARLGEHCGRP